MWARSPRPASSSCSSRASADARLRAVRASRSSTGAATRRCAGVDVVARRTRRRCTSPSTCRAACWSGRPTTGRRCCCPRRCCCSWRAVLHRRAPPAAAAAWVLLVGRPAPRPRRRLERLRPARRQPLRHRPADRRRARRSRSPLVGTWLAQTLFGGEFPGRVVENLYVVHLARPLVCWSRPAAGRRPVRSAAGAAGRPTGVGCRLAAGGSGRRAVFVTAGVVTLMAGTLTISPVWRYGPSSPGDAYAGSQPDWYTAFLDGALRLVPPGWELDLGEPHADPRRPRPARRRRALRRLLTAWPFLEERLTGDRADHLLPDRPRDAPLAHRRSEPPASRSTAPCGWRRARTSSPASCTSPSRA